MHWGMTVASLSQSFALKTPTAGGVTARQVIADDNSLDAAIATTRKTLILRLSVRESKDDQAPKTLSGNGGSHE